MPSAPMRPTVPAVLAVPVARRARLVPGDRRLPQRGRCGGDAGGEVAGLGSLSDGPNSARQLVGHPHRSGGVVDTTVEGSAGGRTALEPISATVATCPHLLALHVVALSARQPVSVGADGTQPPPSSPCAPTRHHRADDDTAVPPRRRCARRSGSVFLCGIHHDCLCIASRTGPPLTSTVAVCAPARVERAGADGDSARRGSHSPDANPHGRTRRTRARRCR